MQPSVEFYLFACCWGCCSMPASRLYMNSMFGQFDTGIKIGRREMEVKSVSLKPNGPFLEK
jgi:hypothetical protein